MIEGMIVVIVTMMILVWLISLGFVYYQRYLVTAITNDACTKVAATYSNAESDIVMGYIDSADITNRNLYRSTSTSDEQFKVNQQKVEEYVIYALKKTNFTGTIKDVNVKMELVNDSTLRQHIQLETTITFNTPLGFALEFFGMGDTQTYSSSARSDCTDVINYMSLVDFRNYALNGGEVSMKLVKLLNSLIEVYNKFKWVKN